MLRSALVVSTVLVVALLAAGAAIALGCGSPRPVASEPQDGEDTPWCVRALALHNGQVEAAEACFQTELACREARASALRWGGLGHITAVGECELTATQSQVLASIKASIATRGFPPTVRELADLHGWRSTNAVFCVLTALEKKGHIKREPLLSRGIRVLEGA